MCGAFETPLETQELNVEVVKVGQARGAGCRHGNWFPPSIVAVRARPRQCLCQREMTVRGTITQKACLCTAVFLVGLAAAGCGSSGTPAAESACQRMWSQPNASADGVLTERKMIAAAGRPDSIEPQGATDIYGKPLGYRTWRWDDTSITFARDGKAVLAIC
jgi:hypothetical protein